MGLGLAQYVPLIIYYTSMIIVLLSMFWSPKIGVLFLFPLLPYQNIFQKIQDFPLGKDLNDIMFGVILIGWFMRKGNKTGGVSENTSLVEKTDLNLPIMLIVIVTFVGFINGSLSTGLSFDLRNPYLLEWKNYMLLPLVWFLTVYAIKDRKTLKLLSCLMVIGILGVSFYFYNNLQWMNIYHFSHKARNMMTGLFVYLGANHYGAFFAHFVFILIAFFLFDKSKIRKMILLGSISLAGYCLIYTLSRGAYIAFLGGILFIGLVKDKKILLLLILFFIFWRSLVPPVVKERIEMTRTEGGELEHSAAVRVELWNTAWGMFMSSPLIGKGFNTFQSGKWRDTHNFYLKLLAELGVLGLGTFLFLCYRAFITAWRLYKEADDDFFKAIGLGFSACVISAMLTNGFGDRWSYLPLGAYFWIFLGITTRAYIIMNQEKIENSRGEIIANGKINNKS